MFVTCWLELKVPYVCDRLHAMLCLRLCTVFYPVCWVVYAKFETVCVVAYLADKDGMWQHCPTEGLMSSSEITSP